MFLQVLFILPPFHDRQQYNDKSTAFDTNMNKERFHNQLALHLGYQRIVNDKQILISVEESDDPIVTLKVQGHDDIRFKASDNYEYVSAGNQIEINEIIDAVHQAYINTNKFKFA